MRERWFGARVDSWSPCRGRFFRLPPWIQLRPAGAADPLVYFVPGQASGLRRPSYGFAVLTIDQILNSREFLAT